MEKIINYIEQLTKIASPTGMTDNAADFLMDFAKAQNIDAEKLWKGAVIFRFNTESENLPLIISSHIDTLGAMVKSVGEDTVDIVPVGGFPMLMTMGNYCTIHSDERNFSGTILPKNPAVHVNRKLGELAPKPEDVAIRVDFIPEEGKSLSDYIEAGDFVSFNPDFSVVEGFVKSRHLDDKASAAILMNIATELKKSSLDRPIYLYFNITEETGQGFSTLPTQADLLVVDMGVVGDGCQGKETHVSICVKDSSGPYNHSFIKELKSLAKKKQINYVLDIFPYYGSDGSAALSSGKDYRVALIGPGVSASHGWERTHTKGLENTYNLVKAYIGL